MNITPGQAHPGDVVMDDAGNVYRAPDEGVGHGPWWSMQPDGFFGPPPEAPDGLGPADELTVLVRDGQVCDGQVCT